jgi:hypothetical protein
MFRFILVLTFSMLSAFGGDYFPLVSGSQWVYRGSLSNETLTVKMGPERQIAGHTYTQVTGYGMTPLFVRQAADGAYVYWNAATQADEVFLAFNGPGYAAAANDCKHWAQASDDEGKYSGPLGDFGNARQVKYAGGLCADTGLISETFVPNLGLVQRTVTSFTGERQFDLVYAQIGGVTYITDAQVLFAMSLAELPNVNRERPLTVRLILDNRTPFPLELTFPSSQRFDFRLRDSRGQVVHTWSATRLFLQVVETLQLTGEHVWQAEIPLAGLQPGSYVLEGNLTNTNGKRFAAIASFDLR